MIFVGMEQEKSVTPNEQKGAKGKGKTSSKVVSAISLIAMSTALMCALAPLSIPIQPVAITLATLALYVIGALLPFRLAAFPILLYLLLGFVGLPIFSNFQGGAQVILGPTGGFLMGYLPCILLESLLISLFPSKKWMYPLSMVLGTILLYAFGTLWIVFYGGYEIGKALTVCVLPFLLFDALKIVVASVVGIRLRKRVSSRFNF